MESKNRYSHNEKPKTSTSDKVWLDLIIKAEKSAIETANRKKANKNNIRKLAFKIVDFETLENTFVKFWNACIEYNSSDLKKRKFPTDELGDFLGSVLNRFLFKISTVALLGILIASITPILLYQQNQKIDKQTELLELQTLSAQIDQIRKLKSAELRIAYIESNLNLILNTFKDFENQSFEVLTIDSKKINNSRQLVVTNTSNFRLSICEKSNECDNKRIGKILLKTLNSNFKSDKDLDNIFILINYLYNISNLHTSRLNSSRIDTLVGSEVKPIYLHDLINDAIKYCYFDSIKGNQILRKAKSLRALEVSASTLYQTYLLEREHLNLDNDMQRYGQGVRDVTRNKIKSEIVNFLNSVGFLETESIFAGNISKADEPFQLNELLDNISKSYSSILVDIETVGNQCSQRRIDVSKQIEKLDYLN